MKLFYNTVFALLFYSLPNLPVLNVDMEQMPLKQFSFCSIDIRDHSVSLTLAGYQVANIIFASFALSD
jgi:hypothetical protein